MALAATCDPCHPESKQDLFQNAARELEVQTETERVRGRHTFAASDWPAGHVMNSHNACSHFRQSQTSSACTGTKMILAGSFFPGVVGEKGRNGNIWWPNLATAATFVNSSEVSSSNWAKSVTALAVIPSVSTRCHSRLSLGRLHLLPERGRPAGPQDLGAGHPAGPAPRPGPRLRRHGGRSLCQLFWCVGAAHLRRQGGRERVG